MIWIHHYDPIKWVFCRTVPPPPKVSSVTILCTEVDFLAASTKSAFGSRWASVPVRFRFAPPAETGMGIYNEEEFWMWAGQEDTGRRENIAQDVDGMSTAFSALFIFANALCSWHLQAPNSHMKPLLTKSTWSSYNSELGRIDSNVVIHSPEYDFCSMPSNVMAWHVIHTTSGLCHTVWAYWASFLR